MNTGKTRVAYKKGEIYLCARFGEEGPFQEVEILDVSQSANAVKISSDGWHDAAKFHSTVKGKIGHVEYRGWWVMRRRIVVRE